MTPHNENPSPEDLGTTAGRKTTTSRSAKSAGLNPEPAPTAPASAETSLLDTAQDKLHEAVAGGKKWLDESQLLNQAGQLPQQARDLGRQALSRVAALTTTQKVVGLSLLTAGIALLATRGKRHDGDETQYRAKPRRSPFEGRDAGYGSQGQRGRAGSYGYGAGNDFGRPGGAAGSYGSDSQGRRRDQGPGRYDASTGGRQNPNNNVDESPELAF